MNIWNYNMKSSKTIFFTIIFIMLSINIFPDKPEKDETIILPSTYGWYAEGKINVSVRAWIFELEENSILRNGFIDLLEFNFENAGNEEKKIFEERIRYFLADNHRGKDIIINIMGEDHLLSRTAPNGHSLSVIKINDQKKPDYNNYSKNFYTLPGDEGTKTFSGTFNIISQKGYSIISDIDDTIKVSNVLDKKELLHNTFIRKFVPVRGMPELYRKFEKKGTAFHYVSGSPWQLYPAIHAFLQDEQFPAGSVELKIFRLKDKSFINFIKADQLPYKLNSINTILNRFPQRKFILIGDSGEKDPEVYTEIAGKHKGRIKYIFIRDVGMIDENSPRRKAIVKKSGDTKIIIFKDPMELEPYTLSL